MAQGPGMFSYSQLKGARFKNIFSHGFCYQKVIKYKNSSKKCRVRRDLNVVKEDLVKSSVFVTMFLLPLMVLANTPRPATQQVLEEALALSKQSKDCQTHTYRFKEITQGKNCSYYLEVVADDDGEIIKTFYSKRNQDISKYKLTFLTVETWGENGPTEKTYSIKGIITHRIYGDYTVDIENKFKL